MESEKKVIFQKFDREKSRYAYPYPPVYREPDTDYICFTRDEEVHSAHWKIQQVESLEQEALEPYLEGYGVRLELRQEQIQMGPLFEDGQSENLVTVPSMEELPLVKLDLSKFEPTADENGKFIWRRNPVYQKGKYKGRPLLLTIGVPVSNQIETIDRCLSHVKPLLDGLDAELVVIDTGSTDGTIEVCKSYGARIYEHPWHDNMSAVRNEAIYHARGLWFMSIDDDEWFEDVEDILQFFKTGAYRKYSDATYIQRNYTDSQGKLFEDYHTLRMAEITQELHFQGRIHDALIFRKRNSYQMKSYAHHYGFVRDKPERVEEKFMRNASILLYDVYEYPEDLRYLFQLACEYRATARQDIAVELFAQTVALAKGADDAYSEKNSVVLLLVSLFDQNDRRLFQWAQYLSGLFPMTVAERACIAWCRESLAIRTGQPAEQVLTYYECYEELLNQYRKAPEDSQRNTFFGLAMVEHETFFMDADAMAFLSYLKTGEEGRALELLKQFSLDVIRGRDEVLSEGVAAGDAVYEALCGKLTALQWEEWSRGVLDGLAAGLTRDSTYERQAKRFPEVLSRISVSSVLSWLGGVGMETREKLLDYALASVEEGRIFAEETPMQELALCARVLKEAYAKNHIPEQKSAGLEGKAVQAPEPKEQEKSRRLLKAYILAEGAFAERYYSPALLEDGADTALPPDVRAAYRMAAALADGAASSGNVALLKQALAIFPPFHQEVRSILAELR